MPDRKVTLFVGGGAVTEVSLPPMVKERDAKMLLCPECNKEFGQCHCNENESIEEWVARVGIKKGKSLGERMYGNLCDSGPTPRPVAVVKKESDQQIKWPNGKPVSQEAFDKLYKDHGETGLENIKLRDKISMIGTRVDQLVEELKR